MPAPAGEKKGFPRLPTPFFCPSQTTAQPQQPQQPKKPTTSAQYYKVRKGDNLGKIAAKYHTTVSKIKKLNHLRSDFIREGQRLRVR